MNSDKRDGTQHHVHHKKRGAKTFRRGKALAFLERLKLKRSTIQQQLDQPEFQSIQQILIGELKAIDMMMEEFKQLFELQETDTNNQKGCEEQNEEN
ncbi:hypothetical protein SAMN04487943_101349 [Gracilibacillus orientalis]|uniref:Uncharacterized protein n=1 Tax=Gracilibacillus orientalis TaxID=334253 RepID=A0A1I4HCA7_9BACI|nr:hypothetical protein [Gracilibacillus orientalis]SFL39795.1 hypothetical protein SAMN04487943_101349 [Gracilibacillus orientalis]